MARRGGGGLPRVLGSAWTKPLTWDFRFGAGDRGLWPVCGPVDHSGVSIWNGGRDLDGYSSRRLKNSSSWFTAVSTQVAPCMFGLARAAFTTIRCSQVVTAESPSMPAAPSVCSRRMSACPTCRADSSIMWT